jgi:hypothetical protein
MRTSRGWSDACILNVSSRGLMVHANLSAFKGSSVELWHGDQSIAARVVWQRGAKAGLEADEAIPVEEMLSVSEAQLLQALGPPRAERRKCPRTHDDSRFQGRIFEFASIAIIAAALGFGFSSWVSEVLGQPLTIIRKALGG